MTVEQDEILLRKKARRRLVGAILLTLILVLSLPLVLEDPSQPLGDGPDIVIPEPAKVQPPRAAQVPDSLPDDNVGEEVLPLEAGAASPAPPSPPAAAVSPAPAGTPAAAPATAPAPGANKPAPPPAASPAPADKTAAPAAPAPAPAAAVAKPAPPADKPAPVTGRGHLLQLGLFKERANADKVAAQASALGLKPVLAETAAGSWRVGVGPFSDKAEALAARDKLRDAGLAVVVKAP